MRRNDVGRAAGLLMAAGFCAARLIEASSAPARVARSSATVQDLQKPKAWVVIRPLQCMDNPWERDWLAHHKKKASLYPRRDEAQVLKAFFAKHGVRVWEVRARPYISGTPLSQSCGSQRGDTLYLWVNADEAPRMKDFGYDRIVPEELVQPKKK